MSYYIKSSNMQVISLFTHDKGQFLLKKKGIINTSH